MKTLAFFALTAVASAAALANPPSSGPKIEINGTSSQTVTVNSRSSAHNHAEAYASAIQNLSSNRGAITVGAGATSTQETTLSNGANVSNHAWNPGDLAIQNVSSNYGGVQIQPNASSYQNTWMSGGSLSNTASGGGSSDCRDVDCKDAARAMQNVSSNAGNVSIKHLSDQRTSLTNTTVSNEAEGKGAVAVQSLSSNTGKVDINGRSYQSVSMDGATVKNLADGTKATAVQNLASNYDGVEVAAGGYSSQLVSSQKGSITNEARGAESQAFQNLSSNFGDVLIKGSSTQITSVQGTVLNLAKGMNSLAVQNLASNDACDPPKFALPDCPSGYCGWGKVASK